jgi:HPr kinase/phosphorylase
MKTIHGTALDIDGVGILLLGPSGSGKSDLALRLIDNGARLVADDRVVQENIDGVISLSPPKKLAGLLEVRGVGILRLDHAPATPLQLIVHLAPGGDIERLPEAVFEIVLGVHIPSLTLDPFHLSTPVKIKYALMAACRDIELVNE